MISLPLVTEWIIAGLLFLFFVWGSRVYLEAVTYATSDTCALFHLSCSLKKGIFFEKNTVLIWPEGHNQTCLDSRFASSHPYFSYNIYLNLLRLLPQTNRIFWAKTLNFFIYLLYIASFFALLAIWGGLQGIATPKIAVVGLACTLLVAIRAKLLFLVSLCFSEVLNYFFLTLHCILASLLIQQVTAHTIMLFGLVTGLAVRNRQTDLIYTITGFLLLLFVTPSMSTIFFYLIGLLLPICDMILLSLKPENETFNQLKGIISSHNTINSTRTNQQEKLKKISEAILYGLKKILNPYSDESLWMSLGIFLLALPLSITYLIIKDQFSFLTIYITLCIVIYISIGFFVKHFIFSKEISWRSYFGERNYYPVFIMSMIINSFATLIAIHLNDIYFISFIIVLSFFYITHQAYRYIDARFQDVITENGLTTFDKTIHSWSLEARRYLESLNEPAIIMGNYLYWGEVAGFYQWNGNRKMVNVMRKLTDNDLLDLVHQYGITHILLTPFSFFLHDRSSLRAMPLGNELRDMIKLDFSSPNLKIFKLLPR